MYGYAGFYLCVSDLRLVVGFRGIRKQREKPCDVSRGEKMISLIRTD